MHELTYLQIKHAYSIVILKPVHQNTDVTNFIKKYCLYADVTTLFSEKQIDELLTDVFNNENVIRFIFDLTYHFHAHFNLSGNRLDDLTKHLANAIAIESPPSPESRNEESLVPRELTNRILSTKDIQKLLEANKWLTTIVLLSLLQIQIEEK